MALTKVGKEGVVGLDNSADATAITISSGEVVTLSNNLITNGNVLRGANDSSNTLGGGTASNSGGNIAAYGSSHSSLASNIRFRSGSTVTLLVDSTGHVTMPMQPYFRADKNGTAQTNISSAVTVTFDNERIDTGSDYDTSNSTFTAPVTGTYVLSYSMRLENIDSASSYYNVAIVTSNRAYNSLFSNDEWAGDVTYWQAERTVVADMDAGDTASVELQFVGGTAQTDIAGSANYTVFQGCLVS